MYSPLQWSFWPQATLTSWQCSIILCNEPCISSTMHSLFLTGILLKEITRAEAPRGNGFSSFVLFIWPEFSVVDFATYYSISLSSRHGMHHWARTHSSQTDFLYFPLNIRKQLDKPLLLQLFWFHCMQAFTTHNSFIHSTLCSCFSHAFINILLSWI